MVEKNKQNQDAGDFNKIRPQHETAKHHLNPSAMQPLQTPPKSELGQSKKRSFPRGRSGTFKNPKGKEKSPSIR